MVLGVGAIYIKRPLDKKIEPLIYGGGQERNLRFGTVVTSGCSYGQGL